MINQLLINQLLINQPEISTPVVFLRLRSVTELKKLHFDGETVEEVEKEKLELLPAANQDVCGHFTPAGH